MQQYQGVSGLLGVLAVLQLGLAQIIGWDDPSVTWSNKGLRILKRGGQLQSVYRISYRNQKIYPMILQILKRSIPKMNIVSNQSEKWVKLIFSFFMVQDDIQIPPTNNLYGTVDSTSGEPTWMKRLNKTEWPIFLLLDQN